MNYEPRVCNFCGKVYTPRMNIQKNCSSACAQRKRDDSKSDRRRAARDPRGAVVQTINTVIYTIIETRPFDYDLLYSEFTGFEMESMLELGSVPYPGKVRCNGIIYNVEYADRGEHVFQRLVGCDNPSLIIKCKADGGRRKEALLKET